MAEAAIHAVQLEGVETEIIERRLFAGEQSPAGRVLLEIFGVGGDDGRRIVGGIDGEGNQLHLGCGGGFGLEMMHFRTHHGAGAGAGGVKESATQMWPSSERLSKAWPVWETS